MGAYWLTDLVDVVEATGLEWRIWPGWETRSRSSGGYDQVYAVFCHHTASDADPDADARYMWETAQDAPIGALLLERSGRVTVGAAGATNTQGKGGPWTLSRGTIPLDKGNAYGIAIEAANDGIGEPWSDDQCSAYVVLVGALCDAYGLDPARDVLAHWEWCEPSCPGRKVDPAGPSPWASGTASWAMNEFRADLCFQPPPEEDAVTDADIEAIAQRCAELVWDHLEPDIVSGEDQTMATMLRYTRADANKTYKRLAE